MDPLRRVRRHPPPPPGGGREDCWSEAATAALVDAWGDRYLHLSRGNLRQNDWADIAAAVNDRLDALGEPRKTGIQCKNRVDTVKKKYKIEKARPGPSLWPFFSRLDLLVGAASTPVKKNPAFIVKHPNRIPNSAAYPLGSVSRSRMDSPLSTESSGDDSGRDDDDENEDGVYDAVAAGKRKSYGSSVERGSGSGGSWSGSGSGGTGWAFGELAKAVLRFTDMYEKVESMKQQQLLEMEKQRMEFAKDLEYRRMQMFMDVQLELEKVKQPKYASGSGTLGEEEEQQEFGAEEFGAEDQQ